ncbi:putative Bacteriohemerythrin [Desulfamplus magnetovallimortis]|uniref:Putative Bacteriohemerythrin n=1 Tax=Desulfamplus magnetovallimortis TaxID=1246637 RepID=A0A1W1HIB7_9BACT|nr:bacteriohemerythrin [Desulfamplus magnetovallimortis]SLM32251.1 putative Bacteriohemerythrin [Desulfamplus magnetovallimortis]
MPQIVWTEKFSVGYPEIDRQHKEWIKIFNTAYDKMMSNDMNTISELGINAIQEMLDYAEKHFAFEEAYMKEIGYPQLAEHTQIHISFKVKLKKIHDDFQNGIRQLNSEIMKIVENWLVYHILSEDQKYKKFTLSD